MQLRTVARRDCTTFEQRPERRLFGLALSTPRECDPCRVGAGVGVGQDLVAAQGLVTKSVAQELSCEYAEPEFRLCGCEDVVDPPGRLLRLPRSGVPSAKGDSNEPVRELRPGVGNFFQEPPALSVWLLPALSGWPKGATACPTRKSSSTVADGL